MKRGLLLLSAACAMCMAANADVTGQFSTGYSYTDINGLDEGINNYNVGGVVSFGLGDNFYAQGSVDYSRLWAGGGGLNNIVAGGAVYMRGTDYAVGGYGFYNDYFEGGDSAYYGTFGAVGEYYTRPDLTWRGFIGGMAMFGETGLSGGVGASWYVNPDVSLNIDGDANTISSLSFYNLRLGAEYLVSKETPITIGASYTRTWYNVGSINSNVFMIKLTYRIGQGSSLVEFDRSGPMKLPSANVMPFL